MRTAIGINWFLTHENRIVLSHEPIPDQLAFTTQSAIPGHIGKHLLRYFCWCPLTLCEVTLSIL